MKKEVKVLKENEMQKMKLDVEELENLFIEIFNHIQMPIRKSQLVKFPAKVFELKNSKRQIDFALNGLIDEDKLIETKHFICTPELANQGRLHATPTEESVIKYLLSGNLKETIKAEVHFNPLSPKKICPKDCFKYIKLECPFTSSNPALAYMDYFDRKVFHLNNCLYTEMNDFPYTDGFLTRFFGDRDSRLIIKSVREFKTKIIIQVVLLPGRGNYRLAHEKLEELEEHLPTYFDKRIIVKSVPLGMAV